MCAWPTEKCHHAIAGKTGNLTSITPHRRAANLPISVNEYLKIFGVQSLGKLRRSYQVTKHHGDLPKFSFAILRRGGYFRAEIRNRGCDIARLVRCRQCSNGPKQYLSMT